jgi:hypothetical protein
MQGAWLHLGYAKVILSLSTSPLLIIVIYKQYTNSENLTYKDKEMLPSLEIHNEKARRSRWRIFIGGDFNSCP